MLLEHQELKTFQAGQKVEWLLPVGMFFVRCKWETTRSFALLDFPRHPIYNLNCLVLLGNW